MRHTSFFDPGEGLTLAELAPLCRASLGESADGDARIRGLASLDEAADEDLSFFDNPRYADALAATRAGCVLIEQKYLKFLPEGRPALITQNTQLAFALAGQALFPEAILPGAISGTSGISERAAVDPSAELEEGVVVEAFAVIGPRVRIGRGTVIGAGAAVGGDCRIGRNCRIGPQTTVQHALIGNQVVLHPGVRIGQDGFGYTPAREGIIKNVQVGRVIIQDDVEIGSNTTVDRGAIRDTVIGEHTKIDNQVQIAHNVRIGRNCIIVSQVGISGSVTIGDGVAIGGQTGVNGHVTIGDGAQIAAVSSVAGDVPAGARWGGTPARPVREWFREMTLLSELARSRRAPGNAK